MCLVKINSISSFTKWSDQKWLVFLFWTENWLLLETKKQNFKPYAIKYTKTNRYHLPCHRPAPPTLPLPSCQARRPPLPAHLGATRTREGDSLLNPSQMAWGVTPRPPSSKVQALYELCKRTFPSPSAAGALSSPPPAVAIRSISSLMGNLCVSITISLYFIYLLRLSSLMAAC